MKTVTIAALLLFSIVTVLPPRANANSTDLVNGPIDGSHSISGPDCNDLPPLWHSFVTDIIPILDPFIDDFPARETTWLWVDYDDSPEFGRFRSASGVVTRAEVTHEDFPDNHESHDFNIDILLDPGQEILLSDVNKPNDSGGVPDVESLKTPTIIEAEWEIGTRPSERGQRLRAQNPPDESLTPPERTFPKWAWPSVGDRVWVNGHWIFDCAHSKPIGDPPFVPVVKHYRTEIHPARAVASMRDQVRVLPGTGTTPVRVTATDLYIHGDGGFATQVVSCLPLGMIDFGMTEFGPCEDTTSSIAENFNFEVCLPPRPHPASLLMWTWEPGPGNNVTGFDPVIAERPPSLACLGHSPSPVSLDVTIPLGNSGVNNTTVYARKIHAGWIFPPEGLRHFQLTLNTMDLHDDGDPDPGDCECTFFWMNVNASENEWIRLADFTRANMNDYDGDDGWGDGEISFEDATFNYFVTDETRVGVRAHGYDQDCLDNLMDTDHHFSSLGYLYCYTLAVFSGSGYGNNDDYAEAKAEFGMSDNFGLGDDNLSPVRRKIVAGAGDKPEVLNFTSDVAFSARWPASAAYDSPQVIPFAHALVLDASDNVYVADRACDVSELDCLLIPRILVFDSQGNHMRTVNLSALFEEGSIPRAIEVDSSANLYVVEDKESAPDLVHKLVSDGTVMSFELPTGPRGRLGGIVLDTANRLYIADLGDCEEGPPISLYGDFLGLTCAIEPRILVLDLDSGVVTVVEIPDSEPDDPHIPVDVALDSSGRLYAAFRRSTDNGGSYLAKFKPNVASGFEWKKEFPVPNEYAPNLPLGVAVAPSGDVYVLGQFSVSQQQHTVLRFSPAGFREATVQIGAHSRRPIDIGFDSFNRLFILDAKRGDRGDYELIFDIEEIPLTVEDAAELSLSSGTEAEACLPDIDLTFTCVVVINNPGPGLPRDVLFTGTLTTDVSPSFYTLGGPAMNVAFGERSTGPIPCSVSPPNAFTCDPGTVPVDGTVTITFSVEVELEGDGDYDFLFDVSTSSADSDVSDNELRSGLTVVKVDVRQRRINFDNQGIVALAILTTGKFDARRVDVATVCFGDQGDLSERDCTEKHSTGHTFDADGDQDIDLVLHYESLQTGIDSGDVLACLYGRTVTGRIIMGCDVIGTTRA